jgi:hypothetical protein
MRGAGAAGWVGRTIAGPGKGLRAPVRPRVGLQQCPSDPGFNRRPRLQRAAAVPPAVPRARPPHTLCRLWVVVAMRPAAPGRQPRRAASRDNAGRLSAAQLLCAAGVSGSGGGLSLPGKTPRPHLPVRPWAVAPLNLLQSSRREIFFSIHQLRRPQMQTHSRPSTGVRTVRGVCVGTLYKFYMYFFSNNNLWLTTPHHLDMCASHPSFLGLVYAHVTKSSCADLSLGD